jgi:hypothetical protein
MESNSSALLLLTYVTADDHNLHQKMFQMYHVIFLHHFNNVISQLHMEEQWKASH